jgi:hypothetical protein
MSYSQVFEYNIYNGIDKKWADLANETSEEEDDYEDEKHHKSSSDHSHS